MKKYQQYIATTVEPIGEIPNNWRLVPLKKYLMSVIDYRGKTPSKKADGEIFLVTARNIKGGTINYDETTSAQIKKYIRNQHAVAAQGTLFD